MAIKLSDSIRVGQQKPVEGKYFNELTPYTSTTQVNNLLPIPIRHIGLTVNINGEEYWYKDGIENANLVLKVPNIDTFILKNQEQDDRLENLEGENVSQYDLINDLFSELDYERARNDSQDIMLDNLGGIHYAWSPTNRTLTLYDNSGTQLSQVSLVSLDNEGTDLRYNATTLSLDLYNGGNELLDSIPVSSFIGSVGTQLQLNSNQLQLKDSQGNILSTVSFAVSNIQGLQTALDSKLDKGGYTGTAQDLKNDIDGIQIGGRNLLLNTKSDWQAFSGTGYGLVVFPKITAKINETFTARAFVRNSNSPTPITLEIHELNSDSQRVKMYSKASVNGVMELIITTENANIAFLEVNLSFGDDYGKTTYQYEYSKPKLERGNKATDWTPAPEDKQDSLQTIVDNVGVGKTNASATEKLDVNGNVKATGFKTPNGTATQVLTASGGTVDLDEKADLVSGKVPASQLPAYVDDVLEFANLASFPATGENGKIYIAIDTNLTYRWGGSSYVVMSSSLALGEASSTAYRGDRGKVAYDHSQATGSNPHGTELGQLSDVSGTANSIVDTDEILKKESGGFWKKITFANFKNWFTTELAKKINVGLDTVFNLKNISAMTLMEFRSITPDIETIYFTEEQNDTGWQQVRYNSNFFQGYSGLVEAAITINAEDFLELDSDSSFNLINVENTKINGIFENDFVIITFNSQVWTQGTATANQWVKVILKINGVQAAVSPVFYLTESAGTPERISHSFALNVTAEMVTHGATLHIKPSVLVTLYRPSITVARVHKSTNANR